MNRLVQSFSENVGAWLLFGALLIAIYDAHHISQKTTRLCDLTTEALDISVPASVDEKSSPQKQSAAIEAIEKTGTVEGRLSLWQETSGSKIEAMCGDGENARDGEDE